MKTYILQSLCGINRFVCSIRTVKSFRAGLRICDLEIKAVNFGDDSDAAVRFDEETALAWACQCDLFGHPVQAVTLDEAICNAA